MPRFITLLLALALLAPQGRVLDLTEAVAEQAKWKIVETHDGGPVGTSAKPPSYKRVTIRLTEVSRSGEHLYFLLEIINDRQVELEVPVGLSSSALDKRGEVIRFRELLVTLGTSADADDLLSFKLTPSIRSVSLFGSRSVPGTTQLLAPGESLTLRLKTELQSEFNDDLGPLQARIGGWDAELTPVAAGYKRVTTLIPALYATSKPSRPNAEPTRR